MAIVRIKLSQGVIDQEHAMASDTSLPGSDPGGLIDFFVAAAGSIGENYSEFASWSLSNSTLRTTYADGAVGLYSGLVLENWTAPRGRASVTGFDFNVPKVAELAVTGRMIYDYDMSGGSLTFEPAPEGMTINGLRVATLLPTSSPDYDPTFGNVSMSMSGALTVLPSGAMQGTIGRIDVGAERFVRAVSVEGELSVSDLSVGGTLKSFNASFHDGSLISVTNANFAIAPGTDLLESAVMGSAGSDDIGIELPGRLYDDMLISAGAGDDVVSLKGGGGRLRLDAGDGNDIVSLLGDRQTVDGGRGTDTVKLAGAQADYTVKRDAAGSGQLSVTDKSGAVSTLLNVERIVFGNATVALDIDGNAGQAYRLYKAVFNRTPDAGGLGFWINSLDHGTSLIQVAAAFMTTDEYKSAYGSSQSNLELVTRFYRNILGRDPEPLGRDFWVGKLEANVVGVAEVMAAISESLENKDGLAPIVGNGFAYTPWGS